MPIPFEEVGALHMSVGMSVSLNLQVQHIKCIVLYNRRTLHPIDFKLGTLIHINM